MSTVLSAAVVAAVGDLKCDLLCRRLVEGCPDLWVVSINANQSTCQVLLWDLQRAQLGLDSYNNTRLIIFYVPGR